MHLPLSSYYVTAAANIFWVPYGKPAEKHEYSKVVMVDWPEVGIFCPFTKLAQFMISNTSITLQRKHEC